MQPSIPVSIILAKGIHNAVLGQVIQDVRLSCFNRGAYKLDSLSFEGINELVGQKVVEANANFIHTQEGLTVEFGYDNGGIRLYDKDKEPPVIKKKPKTGGFSVTFVFEHVCLIVFLNSWTCRFKIHTNECEIVKYPLDITSPIDFTYNRFNDWLKSRGNITILDACATSKGAFDIYISFMNYILWMCGIHPKSKVKKLSENEIRNIYNTIVKIIDGYKAGILICEHVDLYGNKVKENNKSLSLMTAKNYQKPCPKCGTLIESINGTGTKYYFCPSCQKLKN